jgi:hypothetical protein
MALQGLLFSASVKAQGSNSTSCSQASTNCALQPTKTRITDAVMREGLCDAHSFEKNLEMDGYPFIPNDAGGMLSNFNRKLDPNKLRFAPIGFLRAVCNFHSPSQTIEQYEKTIDLFQKSVTTGLMPSQKSAAALLEGISHCRVARAVKALPGSLGSTKARSQMENLYCRHRSMAKEAFSEVTWAGFRFEYETETQVASLDAHIRDMAQCGSDLLGSEQDTFCGDITALPEDRVKQLAAEAAAQEIPCYVSIPEDSGNPTASGCANPPFTAMMARKVRMTRDIIARSKNSFQDLSQENQTLTLSYLDVLKLYGSIDANDVLKKAGGSVPDQIDSMQSDYLNSVSRARSLLTLSQSWVDGLYKDTEGKDLRVFLGERQEELQAQKEFLGDDKSGLYKDIHDITESIKNMAADAATQNKSFLKSMCAFYFCELKGRSKDRFHQTCNTVIGKDDSGVSITVASTTHLCPAPRNAEKPELWGKMGDANGNPITVAALCANAGLDAEALEPSDIESVNQCMQTYFSADILGVKL